MRQERKPQDQLSTLEAQELIYKRRLKEMERTKGLSRGDLIKRAAKLSKARELHTHKPKPIGLRVQR